METDEQRQAREASDLAREESKSKWILWRNKEYTIIFGLVTLVLLMLLWYLWSGRNSANVTGAASAELINLVKDARTKLNEIDVEAFNQRIKDLGATQAEATGAVKEIKGLIADLRPNIVREFDDMHALHGGLQVQLAKFGGISDALAKQVTQEGDTANGLIKHVDEGLFGKDGTLPKVNTSLDHLNDIAVDAKNTTSKLPGLTDNLNTIAITANATLVQFKDDTHTLIGTRIVSPKGFVTGTGLIGVVEGANGIVNDGRTWLHGMLFTPPCTEDKDGNKLGFGKSLWPCVKRTASGLAKTTVLGAEVWQTFAGKPITLNGTVPVKQVP